MTRFIGAEGIKHVAQPPESELCFAAIISAVSGASVLEAHRALMDSRLSEEDGKTNPFVGTKKLEVAGSMVSIDPLEEADTPESVMGLIDEQLIAARAVTLLHKKNNSPTDEHYHWSLLTGFFQEENNGPKLAMRVIDPLREHHTFVRREQIAGMIGRSMDFMGVYAYALSVTREE
jgi:hypothetical protein